MADLAFTIELRQACKQIIADMAEQRETGIVLPISNEELSEQQIVLLAEIIKSLPERSAHAILLRYGYNESYDNISYLLDIENPRGIVRFAGELLSSALDLDTLIAPASMRNACKIYLSSYTTGFDNPEYAASDLLKQKVKNIILGKATGHKRRMSLRYLIIAAVIIALLVGATIGVMAMLGHNIFNWEIFMSNGRTHVVVTDVMRELTEEDFEDMRRYQPTWLPEGFSLSYSGDEQVYDLYEYFHSADGQRIVFHKRLAVEHTEFETSEIDEIIVSGNRAFYYQREQDGRHAILWQQDGYMFQIVSPLDKESTMRIAESVEYR